MHNLQCNVKLYLFNIIIIIIIPVPINVWEQITVLDIRETLYQ